MLDTKDFGNAPTPQPFVSRDQELSSYHVSRSKVNFVQKIKNNAECDVVGVCGEQTEGIHDGESFANHWSHSEIEMRHIVVSGIVLWEYGVRTRFWGLESIVLTTSIRILYLAQLRR
jgi:cupin superfamily acireductone dioxygenase involved in methionine salvage